MEEFEELGLTKNEGKAYSALIEFGKLSAGEISSRSGVSYSRIYDILESLAHKGFVEIVPEKTKKYIPASPEGFIKILDEKEKNLAKIRERVKQLKQFYEVKEKNPVVMGLGQKAFYKIVSETEPAEKYSYNVKWTSEYRENWVRSRKAQLRKGIEYKELVRYDDETQKNVRKWLKIGKNMRKIDNEGIACSIADDKEVMISLIKSNVTLLIRDRPFAKLMKRLFLGAYEKAEPIK